MKETVLYFSPKKTPQTAALKGLLIRMGIRIRNIAPEQVQEQVGALAGAAGFEKSGAASTADPEALEKLQEEIGYPGIAEHKKKHEELRQVVKELYAMLEEQEGPTDAFVESVNENVTNWLYNHIRGFDRSVAEYRFMRDNESRI